MHPILAQRSRLGLYLAGWVPIAGLLAYLLALSGNLTWRQAFVLAFPLALEYAFLCLSAWYLCRIFPLEQTGFLRLLGVYIIGGILSASLWILIGKGQVLLLARNAWLGEISGLYATKIPLLFGVGVLLFFLAVAVHYLLAAFEATRASEKRALELRVLAREFELKALRAQIDPHFLFNSLNSISALSSSDPAGARKMCLLLADFLRKTLNLGREESIPFSEELSLATNYLAIEQVRLGSRLKVEKDIEEESEDCQVPPLLLQPLIENAVHHGIAQILEPGVVRIQAKCRLGRLEIAIENPFDPDQPPGERNGLGMENVRKRLSTLYGTQARAEFSKNRDHFAARLSLPEVRAVRAAHNEENFAR